MPIRGTSIILSLFSHRQVQGEHAYTGDGRLLPMLLIYIKRFIGLRKIAISHFFAD